MPGSQGFPPPQRARTPPSGARTLTRPGAIHRRRTQALRNLTNPPPQLGDVNDPVGGDQEVGRALDVQPLIEEYAVRAEDPDPVVLAIRHEYATVRLDADAVWQVELAWPGAGLAPGVGSGCRPPRNDGRGRCRSRPRRRSRRLERRQVGGAVEGWATVLDRAEQRRGDARRGPT